MLYVGKARSIKKRIAAYMAPERQPSRIARMVAQTRSMVFVTTESEAEALLLEANLIKQLKPRYNVMLRDDKSFPYILICTDHPAARLVKHRGARTLKRRLFRPLRQRRRGVPHAQRAAARVPAAHLLGQLLRATAPGPACSTRSSAARRPAPARSRSTTTRAGRRGARLPVRPQPRDPPAARRGDEPRPRRRSNSRSAARLRDRISALSRDPGRAERQSALDSRGRRVRDHRGGGAVLRRGVLLPHLPELGQPRLLSRAPTGRLRPEEVLDAFLAQFYLDRPAPRLVLLSHASRAPRRFARS